MSENQSVAFFEEESLHVGPIPNKKISNNLFRTSLSTSPSHVGKCLNVLALNRNTQRLSINPNFEEYLAEDITNPDAIFVSFMGEKRVGKSFLLDSLLTAEYGKITRIMCKSSDQVVNSPTILSKTRAQSNLIYMDCAGSPSNQIFLWNYFLSSVIVYNLGSSNLDEQKRFLQSLSFTQSHLQTDGEDLSLPKLILIKRDTEEQNWGAEFVREIQNYGLFQPGITRLSFVHFILSQPYPGLQEITSKELLDIPLKKINPLFSQKVENLLKILKTEKAKVLQGNFVSTKILSVLLEEVGNDINKEHKVSTDRVWNSLVESLAIGFYNFYLKLYEEQLSRQFKSQEPCDKYGLYKKLLSVKRKANKKQVVLLSRIEGFKSLEDDPVFSRYKQRLDEVIKSKENLIKQVNSSKSQEANDLFCNKLLAEISPNNCSNVLGKYCKSGLDDKKADVLMIGLEKTIDSKVKVLRKNTSNSNYDDQIKKLQTEIKKFELDSEEWGKFPPTDLNVIEQKVKLISKKKKQESELDEQNKDLKENVNFLAGQNKTSAQMMLLEEKLKQVNLQISREQKQLSQLRQQRQKNIKKLEAQLSNKLKQQRETLRILQEKLNEARKRVNTKGENKDRGCCCALM